MKKKYRTIIKTKETNVQSKEYTIEQLIDLGEKNNKVKIAPLLLNKKETRITEKKKH